MTAKRGLFWYVDGELLCFPVSGAEVDTVGNNHRRFGKTLPHSLTGGMPYNYFPRGRVELRQGKSNWASGKFAGWSTYKEASTDGHFQIYRLRRHPAIPSGNSIPIQYRGKNVLDLVLQVCHTE